jgi:hypothetical protein
MGSASQWARLACVIITVWAIAGCSTQISGTAVRQTLAGEADCTKVSAPMATIEPQNDAEPLMRIPTPDGWERTTMMDSELIRYAMGNPSLAVDSFAPNVVVTLEPVPANAGSPEDVIDAQWEALQSVGGTDIEPTSDSPVCGFPAQRISYRLPSMGEIPPRSAAAVAIVTTGAERWTTVIGLQTVEPDNPGYVEDSTTILDGFQILPEPDGNS